MNKKSLQEFINAVIKFREDRNWQKMVKLKDTAIATSLEAAELLDHFKWKTDRQIDDYLTRHKNEIEEELMDILFNAFLMIDKLGTDVDIKFFEKMKKNEQKYPVEKVKGKNPHL